MTAAPRALFDSEQLRELDRPTILKLRHPEPAIVLGSSQRIDDLDLQAVHEQGVAVWQRRGGGGAVLLHPEDLWLELWLPRSEHSTADVRALAFVVGSFWERALTEVGIAAEVHRGGVEPRDQGAIACFAAIGPGEISVGGAKLVGISQWRVRQGTLVSSVLAVRPQDEVSRYLRGSAPGLRASTCLDLLTGGVSVQSLVASVVHQSRARWLTLSESAPG